MIKPPTKSLLFWISIILLIVPGLVHAYLLMPFPGSQELNAITVSYYLEKIVLPLRAAGGVLIIWYLIKYFSKNSFAGKLTKGTVLALCLGSLYLTDFMFKAESMFEEPQTIKFANAFYNKVPENFLIIGVVNNGIAKAYPVVYLGYHHKVQDEVGNKPVLVTYCTMCRTGRVYSPIINGMKQNFRLVGARHYNAVIEDESTKTWWYQSTGHAAVGQLAGSKLQELPYEQSTLGAWLAKHPTSLILQPDKHYATNYEDLKDYDRLQAVDRDSTLINKDTLIRKSWVVGLIVNGQPKAYDWRRLDKRRLLIDSINKTRLLLAMEEDNLTYHVFNCSINGKELHFKLDIAGRLVDQETASSWDWDGLSTSGTLKGKRLDKIQAYQEYWHSWRYFHPNTLFWKD
ncbi:DUF3179 domain-containing (seleno)protein [Mucilaginibacter sabulilitoris]|uniref:DUF3179 domain-containing (Seleno)protein n=1 Tax=Mucilaginibacter sabulilitoris TaxID=1173583 RepID=A0ABZ0TTE5_9SPHI|nr:DUF3179 domain-containing (seleno)protein [Mucilaginibacter sabulilitoris]WPU96375.1 DUF3179 domain-containing (seleno)protein [Mucilaginibacter sabulilitoris]